MHDYKDAVNKLLHDNIFSITGETYFKPSDYQDRLYNELNFVGECCCRQYLEGYSSFYMIDSRRVQACAIHEKQVVLVYRGMLEFIFRIAAMMVGIERRQNEPNGKFYEPWCDSLNLWLNDDEFEWENKNYWWLGEQTQRKAFDMLVEGIFVFIVFHEIGHIRNLHGVRRQNQAKEKISPTSHSIFIHKAVQDSEEEKLNEQERLDNHAREIVADTYAFPTMISALKDCHFPKHEYPDINPNGLSATNFGLCVYIMASYFWALSIRSPMNNSTQNERYPSHAFRFNNLKSACLNNNLCKGDICLTKLAIKIGITSAISKLNSISDTDMFDEWLSATDTITNAKHYDKILANLPNWSNERFGVRDEDWLIN